MERQDIGDPDQELGELDQEPRKQSESEEAVHDDGEEET